MLKENISPHRTVYLAKISFKSEYKRKTFLDKKGTMYLEQNFTKRIFKECNAGGRKIISESRSKRMQIEMGKTFIAYKLNDLDTVQNYLQCVCVLLYDRKLKIPY